MQAGKMTLKNNLQQPLAAQPRVGVGPFNQQLLLTIQNVSTLLNVSRSTLERKRIDGTGPPYIRIGQRVLYPEKQFMDWVESNLVRSTAEWNTKKTSEGT